MDDLTTHEPFVKAWKQLPRSARRMLKDFARYPTERNEAYAVGYVTALADNSVIGSDNHRYLLALCGRLRTHGEIMSAIKEMPE